MTYFTIYLGLEQTNSFTQLSVEITYLFHIFQW